MRTTRPLGVVMAKAKVIESRMGDVDKLDIETSKIMIVANQNRKCREII